MTDAALMPFGPGALVVIGAYLLSLLGIGWLGYRRREANTLRDFYLGGRGFGFAVLVLTLYATQYSGNTLFGFTGKAYRIGYAWTMSIHFMTAIVVCYLLFAPRLYPLARREGFITPADYLHHRFRSSAITGLGSVLMIAGLSNYLLAQLMAMGRALEGLTTADPYQAYVVGVIVLAIIMVVYETLGGMRAVAWTDAIQGGVLVVGFAVLLVLVFRHYGTPGRATELLLAATDEGLRKRATPPGAGGIRQWLSYVFLVGLGGALYPQAVQRIYAARSARSLRQSLAVMAFLPLTTTVVALLVGVVALVHLPGLEGAQADRVLAIVLRDVSGTPAGYAMAVILFAAILAAIMSTADSALLSISSMFTKDLWARFVRPGASEEHLTAVGKRVSWAVIAAGVGLAIVLRDTTLIKLLDRKFDLLVQLAPAFMIGIHWSGLRARPVLAGMVAGVSTALGLYAAAQQGVFGAPSSLVAGVHPGLYGLVLNAAIAVGGSLLPGSGVASRGDAAGARAGRATGASLG